MNIFYLIVIILGVSAQSVIKKPYTNKTGEKGAFFFSALVSFSAMLFFILTSAHKEWDLGIVPYSFAFATGYATSSAAGVMAISCGSLSLTALISSFSLMIPTFYGILFLNDPISGGLIPGIIFLSISLLLINKKSKSVKISAKWVICVLFAFVGNGLCSVFQKMQQVAYDGAYKNEFMIIALAFVTLFFIPFCVTKERHDIKLCVKAGLIPAIFCGIFNGIVNLFVMLLSGKMPVSLMFPLISAGGIILTYLVSKFLYKELLTRTQFWGLIMGTVAVVLLNI